MAKHWNPRVIDGLAGQRWTEPEAPRRGGLRGAAGRLRLLVVGGVLAGLAISFGGGAFEDAGARTLLPADVRVIDGDTFDYRGDRIRISDIDTPETNGRCAREIELANRAKRRTREWLAAGPFTLRAGGWRDVDRFGRKLRIVERDGVSIGDTLVSEGLARRWEGFRRPWCGIN